MVTSIIQASSLREQRLRFLKAHQDFFEVEPLYPFGLFEDFVARFEGDSAMEVSCKIEADKLLAGRSLLFFQGDLENGLAQALEFFHQVESRSDVQIGYDLLQKFLGSDFNFDKVTTLSTGIDLRQNLADCSLKMHIGLKDYPEKIETALALDPQLNNSSVLRWIALQTVSLIGFDFYLDGRSEIELYTVLTQTQLQQHTIQALLTQVFPPSVLEPLQGVNSFYVGLSKANTEPVLYYQLKDKNDLMNYFAVNDGAQKVHAFYQQQAILPYMWVGVSQLELQKSRIDNIRLYYHQSFYKRLKSLVG